MDPTKNLPPKGELKGRNLIVCCDGTRNEIGGTLSNVLKLYKIAAKDEQQIPFYQPGIGTVAMPHNWGRSQQTARAVFDMATGRGLDRDVLNAYCFLAHNYREGDNIFLFGFSRGAYTVRVLAGMIYLVGLLRAHQVNFAGFALKAYKQSSNKDDYTLARKFREIILPQCVPIHFLGVWDTVASVIVPGRFPFSRLRHEELPYTSKNPAVEIFRHAMAIDEFRCMFRLTRWEDPQEFKPNPFSQRKTVTMQDVRQVWFAGCHSDVGGGFPEEESSISKYPLRWMLEQAAEKGLRIRRSMLNHIVLGEPRLGARDYVKPNAEGPLHKSLNAMWKILEIIPKGERQQDWPEKRARFGLYFPLGEPRFIPPNSYIHVSVVDRYRNAENYKPVNLMAPYKVETVTGPISKKKRTRLT